MYRLLPVTRLLLGSSAQSQLYSAAALLNKTGSSPTGQVRSLTSLVKNFLGYSYHSSSHARQAEVLVEKADGAKEIDEALKKKYKSLLEKDVWDEVWAYEARFGKAEDPIEVPSTISERIIGVTDPEDSSLVIWGILREGEPPKQLVEGGEFYVLKKVDYLVRVGDVLNKLHPPK